MCKDTTNNGVSQEKNLFSFQDVLPDRKIQVDFNAPDISSNGGLVLVGLMKDSIARKIARLMDFLFGKETACRFLLLDFILAERVARQPLVVDGDEYHRP